MKAFTVVMTILIVLGVVLVGVGCAVYFTSTHRFGSQSLEYSEMNFESEESFSTLSLNLSDAHKVVFQRGEKCAVKYYVHEFSSFEISVEGGVFKVKENSKGGWNWLQRLCYKFKTTDVVITVPYDAVFSMNGTLSGAIEMNLPSWQYYDINLHISGAAEISAPNINAGDITLDVSGATSLNMNGKMRTLTLKASGALTMRSDDIECNHIELNTSGSANINLSGVGNTLYAHVSGSSRIMAKDFSLTSATFDVSGSLTSEVTAHSFLKVHASGRASVSYWGTPNVDKSGSGKVDVVKMS